jgi:lysophospholipase L1-like esterase
MPVSCDVAPRLTRAVKAPALDFDRAVRDPANLRQVNPAYDVGDHLHMNPAGYGGFASTVPASLFRTLEAHVCRY